MLEVSVDNVNVGWHRQGESQSDEGYGGFPSDKVRVSVQHLRFQGSLEH